MEQEVRTDGSGRALLCTILFSAWVLQQKTEARVPLVYRNGDGVDASTLPPIPYPDQRKQGHVVCPGFFPHHSPGTRGNRLDPPPLLVQRAASLQRFALVVTRLSRNGSPVSAFRAPRSHPPGLLPRSIQQLLRIDCLLQVLRNSPDRYRHGRQPRSIGQGNDRPVALTGSCCSSDANPYL